MKKTFRVLGKALILTVILSGALYALAAYGNLGKISLYNLLWPGRDRFPYGRDLPYYAVSLSDLDAMFAAHAISAAPPKRSDEFRVIIVGDSGTWGWNLRVNETIAGNLNGRKLRTAEGLKTLNVYNLAYHIPSLHKDFLIFQRSLNYEPDLLIWPMTLESFPIDEQDLSPIPSANYAEFAALAETLNLRQVAKPETNLLKRIRAFLNSWIRNQLSGFHWSATGVDHPVPEIPERQSDDVAAKDTFFNVSGVYPEEDLVWEIIPAAAELADPAALLLVNEPMFIALGENHEIRYNHYYPRVAYDVWRQALQLKCSENSWWCLDLWDALDRSNFTNSSLHYDSQGAEILSNLIFHEIADVFGYDE